MEFLELSLAFVACYLIFKDPRKENLAFGILAIAWIIGFLIYIGDVSNHILPNMAL